MSRVPTRVRLEKTIILKEFQEGKCAICSREVELCLDHDHETGRIRGLLCYACNYKLVWVEKYLDDILPYLEDSKDVPVDRNHDNVQLRTT